MPNGHMQQDESARFAAKTGWAPRFGQGSITSEEAQESLLDHQTLLESRLDDKFFGGTLPTLGPYIIDSFLDRGWLIGC